MTKRGLDKTDRRPPKGNLAGGHRRDTRGVTAAVDHVLRGEEASPHVILGPLVWREGADWYVIAVSGGGGSEFHVDRLCLGPDEREGEILRGQLLVEFLSRPPLMLHDCGDELEMAKWCEVIWPSARATEIRASIEAEQVQWGHAGFRMSGKRHPRRHRQSREQGQCDEHQLALTQLHAEGQGVWKLSVIFPHDAPALLLASVSGDRKARQFQEAIEQFLQRLPQADPPALCLLCDHEFAGDLPVALVALTAYTDAPSCAVMNGLCIDCARPERLLERIAGKYRDSVFDDELRILPAPSLPGRA